MITGVAFIVIARNEGFGIEKCLGSLLAMPLEQCQIVCIDSNSTDETRNVMERYASVRPDLVEVHDCHGRSITNAAIARNTGLPLIRCEYTFWLDGDVQVSPEFVEKGLEVLKSGQAALVAGPLREIRYEEAFKSVSAVLEARQTIAAERSIYHSGGNFLITTGFARRIGMWDETFPINEDFDYTLRASRLERCVAIPVTMGTHHTLASNYTKRSWLYLRRRYPMYFGMIIRRHCLVHTRGVVALMRHEGVGNAAYIATLLMVVGLYCVRHANVTLWYAFFPPIVFCLLDLARCLLRGRSLQDRFIVNYAAAPVVFMGFLMNRPPCRVQRPLPVKSALCTTSV